jgi:phosphoribosyl-ATP pyrophosphohydrolase
MMRTFEQPHSFAAEFEVMSRFSLHDLASIIDARAASGGEASYTRKLLDKGTEHCAKKFGEEAIETVIASIGDNRDHLVAESAWRQA